MKKNILNKGWRKILPAFLSLTLFFGLIPSENISYAADVALSGASVTYDFWRYAYTGDTDINGRNYTNYSQTRPWAYVSDTFTSSGGSAGTPVCLLPNLLQLVVEKPNQRLVLKIKIPSAGRYKASISYSGYEYAGIMDVYLIPLSEDSVANTGKYLTGTYHLGSVDSYKPAVGISEQGLNDAVIDIAGEYLLVFNASGKNASSKAYNMFPVKLTLNGCTLQSAVITLDKNELEIGDTAVATASGIMSDGSAATDATVSYESSNPAVAVVDAISGAITAISEGSTNITATVTKDGVSKSSSASLTVGQGEQAQLSGVSVSYNFWRYAYTGDTDINGRNYINYSETRPWAYVSDTFTSSGGSAGTPVCLLPTLLQLVADKSNQRLTLKVKIPAAGRYRADITYSGYEYAGIMDIYLIPFSEDSAVNTDKYLTGTYRLGSVDSYKPTVGISEQGLNDAVIDTAGEYLLVFNASGKNASSKAYNMFPVKLTLNGCTLQSAVITLDSNELKIGDTAIATASGIMSDGSAATDATVSYESSNPAVATIDAISGAITAITEGSTNISATVIKYGVSKSSATVLTVKKFEQAPFSLAEVSYKFWRYAYTGDTDINGRNYTNYSETRPWAYVSDTFTSSGGSAGTPVCLLPTLLQLVADKPNQRLTLKVKIPAAGRYRADITYSGYEYAGIMDIYLIPFSEDSAVNTDKYLTGAYRLGTVDSYKPTVGISDQGLNDAVIDTAGEYLLIFNASGKNASSKGYNMFPIDLSLDGSVLTSVDLELGEQSIGIGEETTSNVTGLLNTNKPANLSNAEISFSSSNPSAATVNATTGEITTVSAGDADISVTVTMDGITLSSTKTLHVDDQYTLQSLTLAYDGVLTTDSKVYLSVHGNLKNGDTIDFPEDKVKYMLVDTNPQGAAELLDGGCIVGRLEGTAGIKAEVESRGKLIESSLFTVTIAESIKPTYVAGFSFNQGNGRSAREATAYTRDRKWAYLSDTVSAANNPILYMKNCTQIISEPGEWVAYKLQIPEAGNYKATYISQGSTGGGVMNIYLIPKTEKTTADINSYLTDRYLLGQIDGYNDASKVLNNKLPDVYIQTAGEYILVYKSISKSAKSWGAFMYPIQFLLEGEYALKNVSLSIDNSEIEVGKTEQAVCTATRVDGGELSLSEAKIIYSSSNPAVASVDKNALITANAPGEAEISVQAIMNNVIMESSETVNITDNSKLLSIELTGVNSVWVGGTAKLCPVAKMESGYTLDVPADSITYSIVSCDPAGAASVDADGTITGICAGSIQIKGISTFKGVSSETAVLTIPLLTSSKTESTIWTQAKREAAMENAKKYDWAKSKVDSVIAKADAYVDSAVELWNSIVPEGLPRYYYVGSKLDPENLHCRYCGADLLSKYGNYPWITNPIADPFKIKCPACKRRFPSNDFLRYYESGLDERGIFNKDIAKQSGQAFLKNTLYPEKGDGWGVDDGFGYFPGHTYDNGVVERHNYIAYYLHEGLWYHNGVIKNAIENLELAYVYTGEIKYGRAGAIILDRIADFYPDYDWYQWHAFRDDSYRGKILDIVWEAQMAASYAKAYDAFFPAYSDPQVISFLSEKSRKYKMENPKDSAAAIRKNIEDKLLREIFKASVDNKIAGNFGMMQNAVTSAAVALDTMPDTKQWIDWVMQPGTSTWDGANPAPCTGGNVLVQLVNKVDRDGNGTEAAPGYNALWVSQLRDVAELLHDYKGYPNADLYKNPKFAKMFSSQIPVIMALYYTMQIGDSDSTASTGIAMGRDPSTLIGFSRLGTPQLGQILYMLNNNSVAGIHEDITVKNPEEIQNKIMNVIDKYGKFNLGSDMETGYGFAALRDGAKYESVGINATVNNLRDFSLYFGRGIGHGHYDCLNLGIDAYGLNMAPDFGYPEQTGTHPNNVQFVKSTICHNTVTVDGRSQKGMEIHGYPLHFDDSSQVKLMDIDASTVYSQTDIYHRTVVMVKVSDDVSYGVDFFRVSGGDDHIYSFHSQSDEIYETEGLNLVPQVDSDGKFIGTYAGADVPWGPDPLTDTHSYAEDYLKYPTGATWLDAVRRDTAPESSFAIDFKVKDFRHVLPGNPDLHLRITMLNDFNPSEVVIAHGKPPQTVLNTAYMSYLQFALVRRIGKNLDSLFTTVYEPYKDIRYLESMCSVGADIIEGTPGTADSVKAIKVTHKGGKVDYVVYATNNKVKYKIDNLFDFRGVVGVYTLLNGKLLHTYINDGDTIGESTGNLPAVTGVVDDFTRNLQMDNSITVTLDQQIEPSKLIGKYIYISNILSPENGVYRIKGADAISGNKIELSTGNVPLIRAYRDINNIDAGYLYNIGAGQDFRIPLSSYTDDSPVFTPVGVKTVDAKSQIHFTVSATSPIGKALEYSAVTLPRGSSFNPESRLFVWTPDTGQVGTHHVAIKATDGSLSSTLHFEIKVLTATSGSGQTIIQPTDPSVKPVVNPPNPPIVTQDQTEEKFIDLVGFDWAKDAIYSLTKTGVITGMSDNTFSPGTNITRADFTVLLVRALKLESDSTDNFADVSADAYYANALAAAKNCGIVTGIGDNRYNPTAEISRQDLMVIVYRALIKTGYKMQDADETVFTDFSDAEEISDYARKDVAALIKNRIVSGTGDKINPRGNATRAETAVLINRILNKKGGSLSS